VCGCSRAGWCLGWPIAAVFDLALLLLLLLLQAAEGNGRLPLDGNIPDMHATTE
jgi:hypothetical protein